MPFQISLHNRSSSLGTISSISAGPDQFVTCASQVTLTATVVGNLSGHTVLWEQLSGDTQILWLTSTNQTEVTYAVLATGSSDRVFRFYVDKGTPLEQFDDITTWGTPTSQETAWTSAIVRDTSTDTVCRNIPCSSILVNYPVDSPSDRGTYTINPISGYVMTWSDPTCDLPYFVSTTVIQNLGGTFTQLGVVPAGINEISIPSYADVYYLYVNYKLDQTVYSQYSCRVQNMSQSEEVVFITDTNFSAVNVSPTISATYYTLVPLLPIPESQNESTLSAILTTTATYYTLLPSTVYTDTHTGMAAINTIQVTYYSNNGIGG